MNDFLEFSELITERVDVRDAEGRMHPMFALRLIAFRPTGHPAGSEAVLPTVHIAEQQLPEFLKALASKVQKYFPESSGALPSELDSGGPTHH